MRIGLLAAAGAAALLGAACGKDTTKTADDIEAEKVAAETQTTGAGANPDEGPTEEAPAAPTAEEAAKLAADNLAASEKFLSENAKKDGVKVTTSGLQYVILEEGPKDGFTAQPSDIVDIHFDATLKDGTEVMSSRQRGAAARFRLNEFLPGGIEAVQLMSTGDRYRFFLPPELAFGETPQGPIGPNEALIFDIELLNVVDPKRNLAAAEKFLSDNGKNEGVKTTASGLQYKIISEGPADGPAPNDSSKVTVHYVGTLVNGTEFDSSIARGEPATFPVGGVIAGWTEGLQLMSKGDKFQFFIHPKLAYGENPRPGGAIGPNDALVFEVELIEVK